MVLLDTGTPGTSREIYSEDADGETRTRNPWIINSTPSQQQLFSCIAQWLEHWVCNPGVASSTLTIDLSHFASV